VHRVTFDSNVWRKVASPLKFPDDPCLASYQKLNVACRSGTIQGFLSETTFTLEQIKRDDRLAWLRSVAHVGPSNVVVPKITQMVQDHLDDAYAIGIRVLRSKRIAGPNSALLKDAKYFFNYSSDAEYRHYNNKNGEIARALENMGVGIANIKGTGHASSSGKGGGHWTDGIAALPDSEKETVAELVAEWADADAIATSIAHDVVYFCTNDVGKGSSNKGVVSAMSPAKAKAITSKYGIQFVSPDDLVQKLGLQVPNKSLQPTVQPTLRHGQSSGNVKYVAKNVLELGERGGSLRMVIVENLKAHNIKHVIARNLGEFAFRYSHRKEKGRLMDLVLANAEVRN